MLTPGYKKPCSFDGCVNLVGRDGGRGHCGAHLKQLQAGKVLKPLQNRIVIDTAPEGFKTCTRCREVRLLEEFHKAPERRNGVAPHCRSCEAAQKRLRTYGLTDEMFTRMLNDQDNSCKICMRSFEEVPLAVDHNRSCCAGDKSCGNCVRGLLCINCNAGLGWFSDNPTWLLEAVEYLKEGGSHA